MNIAPFLNGLGYLFGKIPIQDRKERWKNELDKLTRERQELLGGKVDAKKADRLIAINKRIDVLNGLFKNSSSST